MAALTIPSLIVNNQEKETVVRLKKAYNIFSNAFTHAQAQYGDVKNWGWEPGRNLQSSINIMDKFAFSLNLTKRCDGTKGCFPKDTWYKTLNGGNYNLYDNLNDRSKGVLADGMNFVITSNEGGCTAGCGQLFVDINGFKSPNVLGKDMFFFYIMPTGIVPAGGPSDLSSPISTHCNGGYGTGCTAWVLLKENMDYPASGVGWD